MNEPIEKRNKLEEQSVYVQAETALCIWEYAHNMLATVKAPKIFNWLKQHEGAFTGRENAIYLAHLVEHAWHKAHGDDFELDGYAFDWEIVPYLLEYWADNYDSPTDINIDIADEGAKLLLKHFKGIEYE